MEQFFVQMMHITNPVGLERSTDEPAQAGDHFIWRWHDGRTVSSTYLASKHQEETSFTFGESVVSVQAKPYGNGAILGLSQRNIPDNVTARMHVHTNCRAAWVYFFDGTQSASRKRHRLQRYVERDRRYLLNPFRPGRAWRTVSLTPQGPNFDAIGVPTQRSMVQFAAFAYR